jgi:hypothetical protein
MIAISLSAPGRGNICLVAVRDCRAISTPLKRQARPGRPGAPGAGAAGSRSPGKVPGLAYQKRGGAGETEAAQLARHRAGGDARPQHSD